MALDHKEEGVIDEHLAQGAIFIRRKRDSLDHTLIDTKNQTQTRPARAQRHIRRTLKG